MSIPQLDLRAIERWAYTTAVDQEFSEYEEADPDWFEVVIGNACTLQDKFRFAADPKCLKRHWFAQQLLPHLCWIYRADVGLPFHFSRLQGLMSRSDYLEQTAKYAEAIYERAEIVERMRLSTDRALQSFAKALLDYRHDKFEQRQVEYVALLRHVHANVLPLFADA